MRAGRGEGVGVAAAAQAGRWEDPTVEAAGGGTRGAHPKHVVHGCDAGRVEAQRLVERRRALPRQKGTMWEEGRDAGREAGGRGRGGGASRALAEDPTAEAVLAGARAERT